MKRILIIDESNLFREYLAQKLTGYGFEVIQSQHGLDGMIKIRQNNPDLIVMDYFLSRASSTEVLEKKNADPNSKDIPVIMTCNKVDRETLVKLSQFGVKKVFSKPLKIDSMVKALSEVLKVNIEVDNTPCVIEANCNDNIIFVEVAMGFNKDKIEMLKYRLQEILDIYKLVDPKVLVIMSGLDVGPNDSLPLASFMSTVIDSSKAKNRNVKVLTSSNFVKSFLKDRSAYAEVEAVEDLETAVDGLLGAKAGLYRDDAEGKMDTTRVMPKAGDGSTGFNMRFEGEGAANSEETPQADIKVAVVDDDLVIRQIIAKVFDQNRFAVDTFEDGKLFVENPGMASYDLVFLDLMMPNMDGFHVLEHIKKQKKELDIIVLSALSSKETVVKALGFGIKSYIIKPVHPSGIYAKALDVLRQNF